MSESYYHFWLECGEIGTFILCWRECKMVTPFWKTFCQFLKQLSIAVLYEPAVSCLGLYPKEIKIYSNTKHIYKCLYCLIAHTWKQPKFHELMNG